MLGPNAHKPLERLGDWSLGSGTDKTSASGRGGAASVTKANQGVRSPPARALELGRRAGGRGYKRSLVLGGRGRSAYVREEIREPQPL